MLNWTKQLNAMRRLWLEWKPREGALLLALAATVGVATGLGVWLFDEGIAFFQTTFREGLLYDLASAVGPWVFLGIVPVLALAGLIVGFLLDRFIGEEHQHGVAGIHGLDGSHRRTPALPADADQGAAVGFFAGRGRIRGPGRPQRPNWGQFWFDVRAVAASFG